MRVKSVRDLRLDMVKGVLVLLMIVYHAMSIATTATVEDFRYLRFVSGSFIFITGYMISRFFAPAFARDATTAAARLIIRGIKLLLVFTVMNVAIHVTGVGNPLKAQLGVDDYWSRAASVYLEGDIHLASFVILLPIGYLLMGAPLVLWLDRSLRGALAPILLFGALLAGLEPAISERSGIVEFMLVGTVGLSLGLLTHKFSATRGRLHPLLAGAALAVALLLSGHLATTVAGYAVGVALVMKFLSDLLERLSAESALGRCLLVLGRYSLLCYIAQIALIHVLFRLTTVGRWDVGAEVATLGVVTAVLLMTLCRMLDSLRKRWRLAERSYRLVFS
jgi:fucose 4-O-acetylase-like acetyltransferase